MKKTKLCAIVLSIVMLLSSFAVLAVPAAATSTTPVFTRIDISADAMTPSKDGTDRWANGDDNGTMTLTHTSPDGTKSNNCPTMSDVKLDADKDYTIEVKARFNEGYTTPNANPAEGESRGIGLIVGSADKAPWVNPGRHYTAMFDRGAAGANRPFRVFTRYYELENGQDTILGNEYANEVYQSTDWHTIRYTIDYEATGTTMAVYFDGVKVGETLLDGKKTDGTALEKEIWEGGYIGVIAYAVVSKVEFKDLCYAEGVTTEPANFGTVNPADVFTRVDISTSAMSASANGADRWSNGDDNGTMTLIQKSSDGTKANNCPTMSDVKLDADKDYTIEVKARFNEGYTTPNANPAEGESRGIGLIVGSADKTPWVNPGRHYTAMFDRGAAGANRPFRVFTRYYALENAQDTILGNEYANEVYQSTDWHTIRYTIDYEATGTTMAVYFDGVKVGETLLDGKKTDGTDLEKEIWEGGYIGVIAYAVVSQVEFKDLCYKEGVTTEPAVFEGDVAAEKDVTVNYVYEDGSKAAEPVTVKRAEGGFYSIESPAIEGFVADQATVSGTVGTENVVVTVKYFKSYTVTVHYVDKDGKKMNEDAVVTDLKTGDTYSVETMLIPNYTADKTVVEGTVASANVEVTVTYSKVSNALTVKYVYEDGTKAHDDVVVNVEYDEDGVVASPAIEGYTPDQATVTVEGMRKATTVTVTYTKNAEEVTTAAGTTATDDTEAEKGCGSSMSLLLIPMTLAAAATVVCKKKR